MITSSIVIQYKTLSVSPASGYYGSNGATRRIRSYGDLSAICEVYDTPIRCVNGILILFCFFFYYIDSSFAKSEEERA